MDRREEQKAMEDTNALTTYTPFNPRIGSDSKAPANETPAPEEGENAQPAGMDSVKITSDNISIPNTSQTEGKDTNLNENSMMTNNGEVCHADLVAEELSDVGIEAKDTIDAVIESPQAESCNASCLAASSSSPALSLTTTMLNSTIISETCRSPVVQASTIRACMGIPEYSANDTSCTAATSSEENSMPLLTNDTAAEMADMSGKTVTNTAHVVGNIDITSIVAPSSSSKSILSAVLMATDNNNCVLNILESEMSQSSGKDGNKASHGMLYTSEEQSTTDLPCNKAEITSNHSEKITVTGEDGNNCLTASAVNQRQSNTCCDDSSMSAVCPNQNILAGPTLMMESEITKSCLSSSNEIDTKSLKTLNNAAATGLEAFDPNYKVKSEHTCISESIQLTVVTENNACASYATPTSSPQSPPLQQYYESDIKPELHGNVPPKVASIDEPTSDSPRHKNFHTAEIVGSENAENETRMPIGIAISNTQHLKKQVSKSVEKSRSPMTLKSPPPLKKGKNVGNGASISTLTSKKPIDNSRKPLQKSTKPAEQLRKPTGGPAKGKSTTVTTPERSNKPAQKVISKTGKATGNNEMHGKPKVKDSKPVTKQSKPVFTCAKVISSMPDTPEALNAAKPETSKSDLITKEELITLSDIKISNSILHDCSHHSLQLKTFSDSLIKTEKAVSADITTEMVSNGSAGNEKHESDQTNVKSEPTESGHFIVETKQYHDIEQDSHQPGALLKPTAPSGMGESTLTSTTNHTIHELESSKLNSEGNNSLVSICIEPGADKPTEILGDKQDAIMSDISVIEASCIDENVTKPHVENNSESHGDAQINSTPYISNAYVAITQDHPLEQALLDSAQENSIHSNIYDFSLQDVSLLKAVITGAEDFDKKETFVVMDASTSTPITIELEEVINSQGSDPFSMQSQLSSTDNAANLSTISKGDTIEEFPSVCGALHNNGTKPVDNFSERYGQPNTADNDPKSKTCNIL